ncbi:MAG: S1C family serine protease, partial [Burkholderiaceae bacterium]|nr:S1C family serine protease [Burkholderiaceae bacterium]
DFFTQRLRFVEFSTPGWIRFSRRLQLGFFASILVISGCSTTYSSFAQNPDGTAEVILTSEEEILSASYEAITKTFPSANVQRLAQPSLGYGWYVMPFLDRTDFRFMLSRRTGEMQDKTKVTGWGYQISTHGTQGLVESRYVNPLINELKAVLKERNIAAAMLSNVSYATLGGAGNTASPKTPSSSGTGFFVSRDGYLITNHHVVAGATEIEITMNDGRKLPATVVSSDSSNDVALLKVDAKTTPLAIVSTTNVKKGMEVFTLGFPVVGIQGQEQKATYGRINALSGIQGDIRFFQIDVPIQPGNSGGPLITDEGQIIGIVTASLNQINVLKATGTLPQNVNYAVKSEYIAPLLQFAKIQPQSANPMPGALKDPGSFEPSVAFIRAR